MTAGTDEGGRSRRIGRVWLASLVVTAAALLAPQAANAQPTGGDATTTSNYVPSTTVGERSLDVTGFTPICIADSPYIQFSIKPIGFSSSGPATLTFYDNEGTFIETRVVPTLSGTTIYPGASVDPLDWPGWKQAPNGNWEPDPTDAAWRDGLTITVEVNPTATTTVSYVPATSSCFGPEGTPSPTTTVCVDPNTTGTTGGDPSCEPCVPGQTTGGSASTGGGDPACDPCVPGQTTGGSVSTGGGDPACDRGDRELRPTGTVDPNCTLPRTGNDDVSDDVGDRPHRPRRGRSDHLPCSPTQGALRPGLIDRPTMLRCDSVRPPGPVGAPQLTNRPAALIPIS